MKTVEKIAVAYGASVLGAAAVSYWRGRSSQEIMTDALMHGAVAGTALTVVGWLVMESTEATPVLALTNSEKALANTSETVGVGKLAKEGVKILSALHNSDIFTYLKENGVKIAEVPENPSLINQDAD